MRLILVDDEHLVTMGLSGQLRKYRPNWDIGGLFGSGSEALAYLRDHPVDVVITDIRMPDMDGLALIKHTAELYPAVKSVILTGYAEFEYARTAIKHGVIEYFLKPIEYQSIIALLDRLERELAPERTLGTLERAMTYIEENYRNASLSLGEVAEHVNLSAAHFSRTFKQERGAPFIQHLTQLRLNEAALLLEHSPLKVYEVGQAVGYHDQHYFYHLFKKHFGQTPLQYREAKK